MADRVKAEMLKCHPGPGEEEKPGGTEGETPDFPKEQEGFLCYDNISLLNTEHW